jgi:hypothetical protein
LENMPDGGAIFTLEIPAEFSDLKEKIKNS